MTIASSALSDAADHLIETALLGEDWRAPLGRFATAAGAHGATLVRDNPWDKQKSHPHNEFVIATPSITESVREYTTGLAPPDPRLSRVNPRADQGFLTDFDQFSAEEMKRDPFYQEFLHDRQLKWHACARVDSSRDHGQLFLSLKRLVKQGHYDSEEIRTINRAVPKIQMATAISRTVMQAEIRGARRVLGQRGEALLEIDARGHIVNFNEQASTIINVAFSLKQGRLMAPLEEDQALLDRALAAPLSNPPQVACIALRTTESDRRFVLRFVPVLGTARDVFRAGVALATVTEWKKPDVPPEILVRMLREAFNLTSAEARISALIGLGVTPAESAKILGIGEGTARNYFKLAKAKIGISRQAELASLITLMRG